MVCVAFHAIVFCSVGGKPNKYTEHYNVWPFCHLLDITDKADGSFSRSRSSSMSSLDNVSKEAITAVVFADAYCRKTGNLI